MSLPDFLNESAAASPEPAAETSANSSGERSSDVSTSGVISCCFARSVFGHSSRFYKRDPWQDLASAFFGFFVLAQIAGHTSVAGNPSRPDFLRVSALLRRVYRAMNFRRRQAAPPKRIVPKSTTLAGSGTVLGLV